jgi:hypothetical protein
MGMSCLYARGGHVTTMMVGTLVGRTAGRRKWLSTVVLYMSRLCPSWRVKVPGLVSTFSRTKTQGSCRVDEEERGASTTVLLGVVAPTSYT